MFEEGRSLSHPILPLKTSSHVLHGLAGLPGQTPYPRQGEPLTAAPFCLVLLLRYQTPIGASEEILTCQHK